MDRCSNLTLSRRAGRTGWKSQILRAAVIGIIPLVGACADQNADKVKHSHQLLSGSTMERPMVISGNSSRDSIVNNSVDEQLNEADWKVLESLGPKAIWERLAEMGRSNKERRANGGFAESSTTRPSYAKVNSTTRPALTAAEIGAQTPT